MDDIFLIFKGLHYLTEGRGCHKLVYIDLSGCNQLTPECLTAISRAAPLLQTVLLTDIHSLMDASLMALAVNCRRIHHISLIGNHSITDQGIKAIAIQNKLV